MVVEYGARQRNNCSVASGFAVVSISPLYTFLFGDWNVRLAGQDVVVLVLTVAQLIGLLVVMAMVMWIKWRKSQKSLLCELSLSLSLSPENCQ